MINTHQHLLNYFLDEIQLKEGQKDKMRSRRNANRDRLTRQLIKRAKPLPIRFLVQGSYAMHTMVQSNVDSSDIDDGAVFTKEDLKGPNGASFSALDAKKMVRDALDDGSFKTPPEVRSNCVRVYYDDGFIVDIPVYREVQLSARTYYELASTDWKESDPEAVTEWFNSNVDAKSPDTVHGRQMRRIVRLLKAWTKSRSSWRLPSGFVLSILVNEKYFLNSRWNERDDQAFLATLTAVQQRLQLDLRIYRPVSPFEEITKSLDDPDMRDLRDRLKDGLTAVAVLLDPGCDELRALKAYKSFFATEYFDARIAELEKQEQGQAAAAATAIPFITVTGNAPRREFIKKGGEGSYA